MLDDNVYYLNLYLMMMMMRLYYDDFVEYLLRNKMVIMELDLEDDKIFLLVLMLMNMRIDDVHYYFDYDNNDNKRIVSVDRQKQQEGKCLGKQ
jgi:hypothetical protein